MHVLFCSFFTVFDRTLAFVQITTSSSSGRVLLQIKRFTCLGAHAMISTLPEVFSFADRALVG